MFEWPVRVYYEDTDAGGIVYYANYLKFMERARTEWLRSFNVEQEFWLATGIGFVVRNVELDLRGPARLDDVLNVSCEPIKVKKASIEFRQTITNQHNKVICSGYVKAACVTLEAMKPTAIPREIIEGISSGI
ncbi:MULTISPECIES: tol-pal system-associated acyl-CoA thioesterase [Gammaproteobacteria]|uniref:tol-pal system-associated acyl-CoA thioesterase n=1 Tax=Gammaproteobacteria TaxID=1236 RepID=UPI000DD0E6AB|nr:MULTISPECIES: tol-pal system-associated acyl-CoA thioesterase [Gammaproteobacteria]RTE87775.1 tol-pal system-associated acyl-CoA thioesterase [Aliidiomarina sp. B3213]TCZ92442.1 tol-pal system-associated acyl-CoA thioesterase [Lysobacter sp. N42]